MTPKYLGNSLQSTGYRLYKLHHVQGVYSRDLVSWIDKHCIVCGRFLPFRGKLYCKKHGEIRSKESRKRSRIRHLASRNAYRRRYSKTLYHKNHPNAKYRNCILTRYG